MKERLDVLLVKRNLAASREKAKAIIMSGNVYVDNQKEDKPGTTFPEESKIEVRGHTLPYVIRGGLKLEKAMKEFLKERCRKREGRMRPSLFCRAPYFTAASAKVLSTMAE